MCLTTCAVDRILGPEVLNLLKFPETVLQVNKLFLNEILILSRGVLKHLIDSLIVVVFNHIRIPFDSEMTLFEEVINVFI